MACCHSVDCRASRGSGISLLVRACRCGDHFVGHLRILPFHYRRLTFLTGLLPPPNASGSTCLKPPDFLLLSRRTGLCSSITSTKSSSGSLSGSLTGLLVSSIITVSLLLSLLGGGVRSLCTLLTSMTSLADRVEGGLRGDDLRGDDLRLLGERE